MSGETLPLNQHDEASVFTSGSLLTAQNGFTGYWQAPDQGSFSYPFEGLDSDFIQVNPIADQHNVFTVLSDLFLVSGQPVAVQAGESDYVLPEVQIIDVMIWQQVQMADGSYAYVEVGEATEIPDQILSSYYNGGLGNTAFRAEFDPEPAHHVDFPDTGLAYRIENGEGQYIDTEGGYDTTGAYFIEIVTAEIAPLLIDGIVGADFHPNGRYVLMRGGEDVETVDNGFRHDAWGDGWLQRVPYGSSTPLPPSGTSTDHILTTDDHSSLTAIGAAGDPAGEDARVRVYTPSGAASVSGVIHVDATAIGGTGTQQGGNGTALYDATAYSGRELTFIGRAQGGNGPTPGSARAEISNGLFSMGLAAATSSLTFDLSAIGGTGSGGSRGQSTVILHNNSISGWGGVDLFNVTLGHSGENAGVEVTDNSFAMGEGNDQLRIIVNGDGALSFTGNSIQGGDGFDIFEFDVEHGVTFSLGASISGFSAFVTGLEVLRGGRGDDQLNGDGDANYLQGAGGNDTLNGGFGDDRIDGGAGNDVLDGGLNGSDTVTFEQLDLEDDGVTVVSRATAGVTVNLGTGVATGAGNDTLSNFENVRGTLFDDRITGDGLANVLNGLDGNDTLNGGDADDILIGGRGDDILIGGNGFDTADYSAQVSSDLFDPVYNAVGGVQVDLRILVAQDTGSAGFDQLQQVENLIGTGSNDTLVGDDFANYFVGGGGNDTLFGNGSSDTLDGGSGDDLLDGGAGADALAGGSGNDTYYVDTSADVIVESVGQGQDRVYSSATYTLGTNVEILALTGTNAIDGTGNSLGNVMFGNTAANVLDGGGGADYMAGGAGDDTYYVGTAGDYVVENAGGGRDRVYSSISYMVGANVEILALLGSSAINASGNALANTLIGNSGANVLDGGIGADAMLGGAGDDTYYVDNSADRVIEDSGAGHDRVYSSASYALGDNVEILALLGSAAIDATGNALGNTLVGNSAANAIDGRGGADYMAGGAGDDTYYVNNAGDYVVENAGEGRDRVYSAIGFTLGANVEILALTGSYSVNATGNALNNTIIGNSGINILDGRAGADSMSGGLGNDTYYVDNIGDVVIENADAGRDRVYSSVSYTLRPNIEILALLGNSAINGTGNAIANTLVGNSAANVLDGAGGADSMSGGLGDDTYYVDNAGDRVVESSGAGRDRVYSSISYTLADNVEILALLGTSAINGTGNALGNTLVGNSAANVLAGGGGADVVTGGLGGDTFVFRDGDFAGPTFSPDRIMDFDHAQGDRINLAGVDANTGATFTGDQAFAFIGTAAFHHTAGELRYEIVNGNTFVSGDTNGDGLADFMIRLDGSHALVSGDFVL